MPTRKNKSRSKELDVVKYVFKNNIGKLKEYLISNPIDSEYLVEDVSFKYGNIERLIEDLDWESIPKSFPISQIKEIYHLDGISKINKSTLEKRYKLGEGVLTQKSKADLLIVTKSSTEIISYKDSTSVAKLGQVSTSVKYGSINIKGGLLFSLPNIEIDVKSHTQTGLTENQFQKIQQKDRILAYFKKNHPEKWNEYVSLCLKSSELQLKKLGESITNDKLVFIDFISKTLFGESIIPSNYKLIIGDTVISSEIIIHFLQNSKYKVICKEFYTSNKFSLIVNIEVNSILYGITKIEPAFDGGRVNVSQTKGIIYYFQQYPTSGRHIWELLKDIPKYVV